MANPRQEEKSTQGIEDAARRAAERTAEETNRIEQTVAEQTTRVGQVAADAGQEVARTGANLLQQNAETLQNAWRFGLEMATTVMGRSAEQFGRTLGLSGDGSQQATERSTRNVQTMLYASTAAANVMGGMSQEYFQFVKRQVEQNCPGEQPSDCRHVAQAGRRCRKADQRKTGRDSACRLARPPGFVVDGRAADILSRSCRSRT